MKRLFVILVAAAMLVACGRTSTPEAEPTDAPTLAPEPTEAPSAELAEEAPVSPEETMTSPLDGRWEGAIDVAGTQLGIIVTFTTGPDGLPAGTIDIPAQGATGLALAGVGLAGDAVTFAIAPVAANFSGTLDGETISGAFEQQGVTGTFDLARTGDAPAPTPVVALPYRSEELSWPLGEGSGATTMDATLTVPEGDGPFPAVVFVAGSGPTDRNWTSPLLPGSNGSAALLADELTRAGYATLRFDKRVTGPHAQENIAALIGAISFQSHLDEVAAAVATLADQPEVDDSRIFALANSEGTLHAMNYQPGDPAIPLAGLVLAAPPGRPLTEVLRQQMAENVLAGEANLDDLLAKWDEAISAFLAGEQATLDPSLPPAAQQTFAGLVAPANQPFSAELLAAVPADLLSATDVPVLVVIGKKDVQVDWEADGGALEPAAGDGVTFIYPDDANHVMKNEPKPAADLTAQDALAYNAADRVLDPQALSAILDWLNQRAGE